MQEAQRNSSPWIKYNQKNRRNEKMALVWTTPLVQWIQNPSWQEFPKLKNATILDFGCGYLDAGIGIKSLADKIDGYDIDPKTVALAEHRLTAHKISGQVYRSLKDIPLKTYDLIIVNSVFQYLKNIDDLRHHLALIASLLKDQGIVIISDLIPTYYSPSKDAIHSLKYAAQHGCLLPMIKHLWFAATKSSHLKILNIDPHEIKFIADQQGLKAHFLPQNLTPSPLRYAVVLSKK